MINDTRSLAEKYISVFESALQELRVNSDLGISGFKIEAIIGEAKRYMKDSKYYLEIGKNDTALTSIAYAEGLLDTLRLLEFVSFSWKKVDES